MLSVVIGNKLYWAEGRGGAAGSANRRFIRGPGQAADGAYPWRRNGDLHLYVSTRKMALSFTLKTKSSPLRDRSSVWRLVESIDAHLVV